MVSSGDTAQKVALRDMVISRSIYAACLRRVFQYLSQSPFSQRVRSVRCGNRFAYFLPRSWWQIADTNGTLREQMRLLPFAVENETIFILFPVETETVLGRMLRVATQLHRRNSLKMNWKEYQIVTEISAAVSVTNSLTPLRATEHRENPIGR